MTNVFVKIRKDTEYTKEITKRKGQEKAMEKVWESWGMRRIQLIISKKLAKKKKAFITSCSMQKIPSMI